MKTCAICGRPAGDGETRKFVTAYTVTWSFTRQAGFMRTVTEQSTRTWDFQHHVFDVCQRCIQEDKRKRWQAIGAGTLGGLGIGVIAFFVALFSLRLAEVHLDTVSSIAISAAIALGVWGIAWFSIYKAFDFLTQQLKTKASEERRERDREIAEEHPPYPIKVYTETEFGAEIKGARRSASPQTRATVGEPAAHPLATGWRLIGGWSAIVVGGLLAVGTLAFWLALLVRSIVNPEMPGNTAISLLFIMTALICVVPALAVGGILLAAGLSQVLKHRRGQS